MESADLKVGDSLNVTSEPGCIVLKKNPPRNLDDLFKGIAREYPFGEVEFGEPCGREVW